MKSISYHIYFLKLLSCLWIVFHLQFAASVSVRLVNGNSFEGRVEVQYNNLWGTICNNNWDMTDANVVCKMLGYQRALATANQFGQGSGQIWLDHVTCFGSESSISECCHKGWGRHSCGHYQDAGVVCQPQAAYPDVSVRLINTIVPYAGQVEVRYYGVWKPICHYSWDKQDGNVVCKMMGYTQGAAAVIKSVQGSGNVWLSNVYCGGYESSIDHCSHSTWGQSSCPDNYLAGVVCISGTPNIAFRLTNNAIIPNEGRLEVRYYGIWGTVCTYFDQKDAHVVCRMLGYRQAALIYKQPHTNGMYRFSLHMYCNGQESSTDQCGYDINEINACGNWDVWVVCKSAAHTSNITVRLMNGNAPNNGRVEIGYQGTWGTICGYYYYWNLRDAHVVCRMMNYSRASWTGSATVKGSGPIVVYGHCKGNEKSLEHCNNYRWYWHFCDHYSDVAVTCENMTIEEKSLAVRLVEYNQNDTGLVEVNYNGTWRPICDDSRWDLLDAHMACKMLGFKGALAQYRRHKRRYSDIWMGGVECSGDEDSLGQCYHYGWTTAWCSGNFQAGVVCEDSTPVQVRLEDGSSPNSGRVALRFGNLWGTICSWGLYMNDAQVICRMLGYPGASRVISLYNYIPENKTVWTNFPQCNGSEMSIVDCLHRGSGQRCSYYFYYYVNVNVICNIAKAPQFQISAKKSITDSTVDILFNVSQSLGTQLKSFPFSAYQVAVQLKDIKHSSKSHEQPGPLDIKEVDYYSALQNDHDSYVTAEILGPNIIPSLTIGDGHYYHGYYNAPLKPERNYRIYVRAVTKTSEGKRVYGNSAFISFKTKPKVDAPKFRINGQHAITASSVKIQFNDSQPTELQQTRVYQVAVEKTEKERFFNSYDQTTPFIFPEENVTISTNKYYKNYITAEVIGPVLNLTIGDGHYYHGYYNAPLEPGCSYKIHVRTLTRSTNGKRVSGHASCVAFTTKQLMDPNAGKSSGEGNGKKSVIGLSVVVVVLILMVIVALVWFILKKRRTSNNSTTNEMSEIHAQSNVTTSLPESHYQSLSFPSQKQGTDGFDNPRYINKSNRKNMKRKKSETSPEVAANTAPVSHYQALSFARGSQDNRGFDNQEPAYHVSNIRLQGSNAYQMNGSCYENDTC